VPRLARHFRRTLTQAGAPRQPGQVYAGLGVIFLIFLPKLSVEFFMIFLQL
jgi:hypothetical protein